MLIILAHNLKKKLSREGNIDQEDQVYALWSKCSIIFHFLSLVTISFSLLYLIFWLMIAKILKLKYLLFLWLYGLTLVVGFEHFYKWHYSIFFVETWKVNFC